MTLQEASRRMYNLSLDVIILFYVSIFGLYVSLKLFYDYKLLKTVNALLKVPTEVEKGSDVVIDLTRLLNLVRNINVYVFNVSEYSIRSGLLYIRPNDRTFFSVVVEVFGNMNSYRIVRHVRVA